MEVADIIEKGENSGVEFKRDDIRPEKLAKEISALSNLEGGHIILGVEDNGSVTGVLRPDMEEWIINICSNNIQPSLIPYIEMIPWADDKKICVISIPDDSPDKPYKARMGSRWVTFVRTGSISREATREEEQRLYQASGVVRYDIKPVPGSLLGDLDLDRLSNYFRDIREQYRPEKEDAELWETLLINTEIMVESGERSIPTVAGMLLFGKDPNHYLPQAGISAVAYPGKDKDYETIEATVIRGPIVARFSEDNVILDTGIVERAIEFVRRNTRSSSYIKDGRRIDRTDYPEEAIRETVVNAIAHRDYTISVTDIELSIYSDRIEVISPGKLPNTITVERMKTGCRATRNELIKEVLRDYGYVDARGLGVPRKIIAGMKKHNGTEPDLVEDEYSFTLRLWKDKREE